MFAVLIEVIPRYVSMSEDYLKEMRKLELQEKELRDRYSTEDKAKDIHEYRRIVSAKLKIAPNTGEKWTDYVTRIKIYQEIAKDKNWNTHVDNPYKVWRTHKLPLGCFMCEDTQFINVLIQVLECMAEKHSQDKFSHSDL